MQETPTGRLDLPEPGVVLDPGPRPPFLDRTTASLIIGSLIVLLGLTLAAVLLLPGPPADDANPDRSTASLLGAGAADGDEALMDLESVSPADAARLARESGEVDALTVDSAWTWTDDTGFNLTIAGWQPLRAKDPTSGIVIRVLRLANLDGRPRASDLLDEQVDCDRRGAVRAGFTPEAFRVSDLDGDGMAEVSVGWWFGCEDDAPGGTTVKLALFSGGRSYLLRGSGPGPVTTAGLVTPSVSGVRVEARAGSFAPEPTQRAWPIPFWEHAHDLVTSLHASP